MKFRVWRISARQEYKDVEANNEIDAEKHYIDPREGFTVTDDGNIQKWWVEELKDK